MNIYAGKDKENRKIAAANDAPSKQSNYRATVQFTDNRPETIAQRKLQQLMNEGQQSSELITLHSSNDSIQKKVIQMADWYAYGSADTAPHVHCYSGGDAHLQIHDRGRVRRYNIIQGGQVHSQAEIALQAASGNEALVQVIQGLIDSVNGVQQVASSATESGPDSDPDDFPSMTAMWNKIGWNFKGK